MDVEYDCVASICACVIYSHGQLDIRRGLMVALTSIQALSIMVLFGLPIASQAEVLTLRRRKAEQ